MSDEAFPRPVVDLLEASPDVLEFQRQLLQIPLAAA